MTHFDPMEHRPPSGFMLGQRFVALDTETTGLWAISHRMVEIAAVAFSLDRPEIDTFQSLINPGLPMPEEVIKIHGITDDMVADADPADRVLERFKKFCRPDDILIAHNAPFDISFIACELQRSKSEFGTNPILDTVDIYRRFFPELPSYSLLSIARALEIAQTQEHRALGDALLVRDLFLKAVPRLPQINSLAGLKAILTVYNMAEGFSQTVRLPESLADLETAMEKGSRIEIVYATASQPPKSRIIRPLNLYRQSAVIYLNAYCELVGAERTFRIDRIESLNWPDD